jgi:hypothetical protein
LDDNCSWHFICILRFTVLQQQQKIKMDGFPFTLEDAMKAADGIRQVCNEKTTEESSASSSGSTSSWDADTVNDRRYFPEKSYPPGFMEGVAAMIASGLFVFSPFRSAILRQASSSSPGFGNFVNLVITPLLVVGSAQVGFATASLVGSKVYLNEVADVPPTAISPMTDLICYDLLLIPKEKGMRNYSPSSSSPGVGAASSWDPRVQTLYSLSRAMETCHKRDQNQK